jgi:hypothetical protein
LSPKQEPRRRRSRSGGRLVLVHGGSEPQVLRAPETAGFGREEQSGPTLLLVVPSDGLRLNHGDGRNGAGAEHEAVADLGWLTIGARYRGARGEPRAHSGNWNR